MQTRSRLSGWLALAVFATVGGAMVAADPAFAKVDVDKLTIGGEIRERYEVRTNATFTQNFAGSTIKSNESAGSHRVRVSVGYDLTPDVSFFAQIAESRIWGSELNQNGVNTAATTSGIGAVSSQNGAFSGIDLHQGYIQLKNVLVPGLSLKIGRQEIIFGDHRLFGNFGWSQVGNSFDALRLTHSTTMMDLDLFWARIVDTEFAAGCVAGAATTANCSGVMFPVTGSTATTDQDVYGAYLTLKPAKNWTIEPYFFLLQDARVANGTGAGTLAGTPQTMGQTRHTLGGRINGKAGGLDFTAEGAYQFGSIASRMTRAGAISGVAGSAGAFNGSRDLHINAHAEAIRIGYTFEPVPMKPRIGFEFNYASGDGDNNKAGNADFGNYNTFDNLYPTNHFHYGYMDLMAWKNMVGYMAMFDVKPSPVSKFQVNFWFFRLADAQDNWYRAGQVIYATSAATNTTNSLGRELDVHYWHTFKEKFKFEIGYGHFFAGAYIKKTFNPSQNGNGAFPQGATAINGQTIVPGLSGTVNDQNWGYVMGSVLF